MAFDLNFDTCNSYILREMFYECLLFLQQF